MKGSVLSNRRGRTMLAALGGTLLTAGVALAAGLGLQNPSFEDGLNNWVVKTVDASDNRSVVYGPGGSEGGSVPGCDAPDAYNICVTPTDTFEVQDGNGTRDLTVNPLDGSKMLRLNGPFHDDSENQQEDHVFVAGQDFTVDPANPVVKLNYNLFTFDYSGFDELRLTVKVTNENGQVINEVAQGGFGPGGDTNLKTTGWRSAPIDLTPYANQQVHLSLELQGTSDDLYGSWGYFDAGTAPTPPVNAQGSTATAPAGVSVTKYIDPGSGLMYFQMENSQVDNFSGGMPLTLDLPINAGTATLSNVKLRFNPQSGPDQVSDMTNTSGNIWRNTTPLNIQPFNPGDLSVEYDATEAGPPIQTQHFIVPIGGIALIDPQGIVYDKDKFIAARVNGASEAAARAQAAISGARVTLQRQGGGGFVNVISADPGISPNVNPEFTGANGKFQWDVSAGAYRVVVLKSGYRAVTSRVVNIPPPVLNLHIAMDACQTKTGNGQKQCIKKQSLLNGCIGKVGKQRANCVKRANARARCELKRGKAKRKCIKRANAIGKKKKGRGRR